MQSHLQAHQHLQRPLHVRHGVRRSRMCCLKSSSCFSSNTSDAGLEELFSLLQRLPGMSAVLPGSDDVKQQIMQTIIRMELTNPCPYPLHASGGKSTGELQPLPELLGDWDLVYASNGTVVTRTSFAQALVALAAKLPGVGLQDIVQSLSVDEQYPGVIRSTNQVELGLGPFGSWRVGIKGSWRAAGPANTAVVAFDEFSLKLCGLLGAKLPEQLPDVRIPLPGREKPQHSQQSVQQQQQQSSPLRPAALWVTSYLDGTWRVGRGGSSDNVFLFRRRRQQQQQQQQGGSS